MTFPRTRQRLVALATLAVGGLLLSGCSSQSGSKSDSAGSVTWLTARSASDSTVKAVEAVAADYAKTHPGFKLNVQAVADRPSFDQKIKVLASGNQLPDMFDADPEPYFHKLVKSGIVTDIGELYKKLGVTDRFYPISLAYPKWDDGSNNLITLNANAEYFWYNKDLFKKAGITPPSTFAEFLADCKELKSAGVTPLSINGKDLWPYYRYLGMLPFRESGNQFLDQLKTGKTQMASATGLKAAEFLKDLGPYFQSGFSNTDYTTALDLFTSGKTAMVYDGTWELPSFIDGSGNLKSNIGYFKMPVETSADATPPTDFYANSGIGTAILKKSMTPQLEDFLKYFFTHYADTAFYDFHVIPSIQPTERSTMTPLYKDVLNDIAGVKSFAKVWDVQLDPNTGTVLGRESTNLLLGQTSTQQFAQQVDQAVQQYASSAH